MGGNKGNNGPGNYNNFDQQQDYNTYGLSPSFLASLNINGPLHTKVFVANVSIFESSLNVLSRSQIDFVCVSTFYFFQNVFFSFSSISFTIHFGLNYACQLDPIRLAFSCCSDFIILFDWEIGIGVLLNLVSFLYDLPLFDIFGSFEIELNFFYQKISIKLTN